MSKRIEAEAIASKYLHKVVVPDDATAYKIQEACFNFALHELSSRLSKEETRTIEEVAYKENLDKETLLYLVVGIELRDKAFAERGLASQEE